MTEDPPETPAETPPEPPAENVVRFDPRALRADVVDVNRIDVDAIIAAKAAAARDEHGFTWEADADGLPRGCPVTPLGKRGGTFYFLTPDKEMSAMPAGQFGQAHIDALFAPQTSFVIASWGSSSKSNKTRVQYEVLRRDLMDACARKGVFDPAERVRGRGAWKASDGGPDGSSGGLVLHFGDRVVVGGEVLAPGAYGEHVYPAGPKLTAPAGDGRREGRDAAARLLTAFEGWPWRRGRLDARLLLGWVGASLMGAAIDWRPQIMLTGDAGMGKSTLQHMLKAVLGERILDVADASAAGLYQTLGFDALGVAFDEFENEDEARGAAVMRLARLASSGARLVRGGADGVPSNYQARGAFLFSAINPPAMRPAEQSRTTILALRKPADGAKAPKLPDGALLGAHLVQRVVTMWPHWHERLDQMRETLGALGHANRAQDQLGTLLAAADLLLTDGLASLDELAALTGDLTPMAMGETSGGLPNWRRALNHILAVQPDPWRTFRFKAIGQALDAHVRTDPEAWTMSEARERLAVTGLALVRDPDGVDWLAFPARHPALGKAFEGTDWSSRRGADGAWTNALSQAPDGVWRRDRFRIGGAKESGVLVRLGVVMDRDEDDPGDGQEPLPL